MLSTKLSYGMALLAGLAIGFIAPHILGYTTAIAFPSGYLGWFGDWPNIGVFAWEWLIVRLPAYGVLGALAAWAVTKVGNARWLLLCGLIILAELTVALWIQPTLAGHDMAYALQIDGLTLQLAALVPAVLLAGFIESRRS